MPRAMLYRPIRVTDAAKRRIEHVLDVFDSFAVMFSGGKDSLTVLHLLRQVMQERGDEREINAVFLDEEILPQSLIDFVRHYHDEVPWVRVHWFAVPMRNSKYVMGKAEQVITYDPARGPDRWVRPKQPFAITGDSSRVYRQQEMDDFVIKTVGLRGKVALFNGIRAQESINRYRSVVNKLNENYITSTTSKAARSVKVIYDWHENDVLRWLHENGVRWAPVYDTQHLAGMRLRVSTALHGDAARVLPKLARGDRHLYGRILEIWPDVAIQARYGDQHDRRKNEGSYLVDGMAGVRRYLEEHVDQASWDKAESWWSTVTALHSNDPAAYPVRHLLSILIRGDFKRGAQPLSKPEQAANERITARIINDYKEGRRG